MSTLGHRIEFEENKDKITRKGGGSHEIQWKNGLPRVTVQFSPTGKGVETAELHLSTAGR